MEVLPMNKNDNRFTEALASALHKMVERERGLLWLELSAQAAGSSNKRF